MVLYIVVGERFRAHAKFVSSVWTVAKSISPAAVATSSSSTAGIFLDKNTPLHFTARMKISAIYIYTTICEHRQFEH